MANQSDKSPAGAAESSRARADEQSAPSHRTSEDAVRDLVVPEGEALKVKGGIPKQPDPV